MQVFFILSVAIAESKDLSHLNKDPSTTLGINNNGAA